MEAKGNIRKEVFALCFIENMRTDTVKVRVEYLLKNSGLLGKDFARYTTPILANELAWGCGFTMFSVILGHMGSDAVAANSIANITKNILLCVAFGISGGSGILVGNELGDGNLEKRESTATGYAIWHWQRELFPAGLSALWHGCIWKKRFCRRRSGGTA